MRFWSQCLKVLPRRVPLHPLQRVLSGQEATRKDPPGHRSLACLVSS